MNDLLNTSRNAQEIQALTAAIAALQGPGPNRKAPVLNSVNPSDFRVWRRNFLQVAEIAHWDDARQRREACAAMEGDASRAVGDIQFDFVPPGAQAATIVGLLDAFERRLIPATAGPQARAEFYASQQLPNETETAYHTRLREIFIRAFPNDPPENSITLIDHYTNSLFDENIAMHVMDANPQTYLAALNAAQMKAAHIARLAIRRRAAGDSTGRKNVHHINHLGTGAEETQVNAVKLDCWHCGKVGHTRAECFQLQRPNNSNPVRNGGRGKSFSPRRGGVRTQKRGGYRNAGNGGRNTAPRQNKGRDNRKVNGIAEQAEDEEADETRTAQEVINHLEQSSYNWGN